MASATINTTDIKTGAALHTQPWETPRHADATPQGRAAIWAHAFGLFVLVTFFSWSGIALARHSAGVATIWLSNGLIFGLVVRRPRSTWWRFLALELAADTVANILYGDPLSSVIAIALCNAAEVFVAASILSMWFAMPMRLTRPKPLLGFLGVAVLCSPLLTSATASAWFVLHDGATWLSTWRTWYLGDMLGMALVAPLVYLLQEPDFSSILKRRQLPRTLLILAVPALAACIDFGQTKEAVVLLLLPSLLFAVFQLGFRGAVLGILVIAFISITLTVTGHGPLTMIPGTTTLHHIIVVQILIAVSLLTAFPVASLLEERKTLELSLQQSEAKYRSLANTDALTGQANRRAFDEHLDAEWRFAAAAASPLSILSMDVDHFKKYNDIYGHIAGDDCLRRIAGIAADTVRQHSTGRLYRLGGEEFAVILPDTPAMTPLSLSELIREAIVRACIEHTGSSLGCQTVSIGVASAIPSLDASALALLTRSDHALYSAKNQGRNRCMTDA